MDRQQLLAMAKQIGHEGAELMDTDKFVRHHRVGEIAKAEGEGLGKVGSQMMNIDREFRRRLQEGADNARLRQIVNEASKTEQRGGSDPEVIPAYLKQAGIKGAVPKTEATRMKRLLQAAAQNEDAGMLAGLMDTAGRPVAGIGLRYGLPIAGITAAGAGLMDIMGYLTSGEETAAVRGEPGAEME